MRETKFKHYAIKTGEGFLAKDSRTNCLEIYEDEDSANKIVRRSNQDISVVPCYVYSEKECVVFDEMYEMLEKLLRPYGREDISDEQIEQLLAKARGES